jgi:hypothetical protein
MIFIIYKINIKYKTTNKYVQQQYIAISQSPAGSQPSAGLRVSTFFTTRLVNNRSSSSTVRYFNI